MIDQTTDFAVGGVIGLFAWFFGGLDGFLSVLLTLSIVDYVLGFMDKQRHHELTLDKCLDQIAKKITIFCLIGISHIIDKHILGNTSAVRVGVTFFYIATEGVSIIKHADALGIKIPDFLRSRFVELEERLNSNEALAMRGEGIKQAIESEFFRGTDKKETKPPEEPVAKKEEKVKPDPLLGDIKSIYTSIYES